jgi:CubicO group peptidase (beta-lactamase class C family)
MTSEFAKELDSKMPLLLQELSLPGIAIALIERCQVQAVRCYGFANKERQELLGEDHRFRLASISKPVSALGVMTLVERGLLDLDAPIDTYLTRWHLPTDGIDPEGITARGLLSHSAGLAAGGGTGVNPSYPMPSLVDILSGKVTPPLDENQLAYYEQVGLEIEEVLRPPTIVARPGEQYVYSNSGYALLQLLIEDISGQSFCDYMQQFVLEPLGMRSSGFEHPIPTDAFATPYDDEGNAIPIYHLVARAAGGMNSTIGDLARFTCAEMRGPAGEPAGRKVLTEDSIALMHTPIMYAESEMGFDFHTGLGHLICDIDGLTNVHHTGGFAGWRSVMSFNPASRDGFVALINSSGGNPLWMQLIRDWAESLGKDLGSQHDQG